MRKFIHLVAITTALIFSGLSLAQSYVVPADAPAYIKRGVEAIDRSEEMQARDPARLPAQVLMLAGLQEGDHIAEITSLGQYYSTIVSAAVGPEGRIDMYDMPYMAQFGAVENGNVFAASHPNATYTNVHYNDITLADDLNAVYNVLYYHDLQPMEVDTAAMNAKVFSALKSGGVYLIVDHKAEDRSGWRDASTIHRIGKEAIIAEVTAAGFVLAQDSDLLAHPEDDRTKMVYAPGTRGGTDRVVLVFKKP